jgi:tetratricopeptide (TPR) repeat protein
LEDFVRISGPSLALLALLISTAAAPAQVSMTIQTGKQEQVVVGLPYTADQTVQTVQHLANGMALTRRMTGHLYRSADGLERAEGTFPSTDPAQPDTVTLVCILDPARHTATMMNSRLKTATVTPLPDKATVTLTFLPLPNPQTLAISKDSIVTTDLGKRTQDMLDLVGKRVTGTIPAGKIGNAQPLNATTEAWVSPQLKLLVKQVEENPVTGERTFEVTNIRSEEPDPALFKIPEGYTVKERPALPATAPSQLGTPPQSAAPQPRTKQIEDALNNPDPGIKNDVAYALALNRDHLADAQILTEQALPIKEQQIAGAVSGADPAKAFDQMVFLSRFWDTTGYVYYRSGKPEKAEAYLRAAWELNPNSLFAVHLGLACEAQHKTQEAAIVYRMALSAKPSQAILDELQTSLTRLGQSGASPLPIDIATPLPSLPATPSENTLVNIVLSHNHPPAVTLLQGDPALKKALTEAIAAVLAADLPDSGPELVIRQARVTCDPRETPSCALHFTNTREFTAAEQARRDALRPPKP